jgi:ribosomal protein L7Ae-like RNA K-turn-binding protein
MSYTNKKLRELAKERKVKWSYKKNKKELCEEMGVEYVPSSKRAMPVTITLEGSSSFPKTIRFPSSYSLAKAVGKKGGSIAWYEKAKKPMAVSGSETVVVPLKNELILLFK